MLKEAAPEKSELCLYHQEEGVEVTEGWCFSKKIVCAIHFLSVAVPCECSAPVVACGSTLEVQGGSKGGS